MKLLKAAAALLMVGSVATTLGAATTVTTASATTPPSAYLSFSNATYGAWQVSAYSQLAGTQYSAQIYDVATGIGLDSAGLQRGLGGSLFFSGGYANNAYGYKVWPCGEVVQAVFIVDGVKTYSSNRVTMGGPCFPTMAALNSINSGTQWVATGAGFNPGWTYSVQIYDATTGVGMQAVNAVADTTSHLSTTLNAASDRVVHCGDQAQAAIVSPSGAKVYAPSRFTITTNCN